MASRDRIRVEPLDPQTIVVRLRDPYLSDPLVIDRLEAEFSSLDPAVHRVLIDFSKVVFMATEAINCLLHLNHRLGHRQGTMRLFGMSEPIRSVFQRTNLENTVFQIRQTESEAIESLEDTVE